MVTHTYNPSFSGGSDQEDRDLKPAGKIGHETLSWKTPSLPTPTQMAGGVTQGVGPEFKSQYHKTKQKSHPHKLDFFS
jgi:hypothetical protein